MAGIPIDFTRTTSTVDKATDRHTTGTTTIPGKGARVKGTPKTYEALKLRMHEAATVIWAPAVYGQQPDPEPGDVTTFEGRTWKAVDVDPLKPDGVLITARIVMVST